MNISIHRIFKSGYSRLLISALVAILLSACGGSVPTIVEDAPVEISGTVGNGPLVGATIKVFNSSGQKIDSMASDHAASYQSNIRINNEDYPLLLSVHDGFNLVTGSAPEFSMHSVVMHRQQSIANINLFSTLIVKISRLMPGGINESNIETATQYITEQLGFGLDLDAINNPVTTRITDANTANLIKASEALGEMVRRTRDTLAAAGTTTPGDAVVDAIAADMIDGSLDGSGATAVDPAISSVARLVSKQVLAEVLDNKLKVGGIVATAVLEQAISTTHPGAILNNAPVISGSPSGFVQANGGYTFQPNATDADDNVLAFSIANQPAWAGFNDTTGRLSGTPAEGDTGSYHHIVISVTDGLGTASLPAFSIQVDAAPVTVPEERYTISWAKSVALSDGTP